MASEEILGGDGTQDGVLGSPSRPEGGPDPPQRQEAGRAVAEVIPAEPRAVRLVGHLPQLRRLANLLLTGDPESSVLRFPMAGIKAAATIQVRWFLEQECYWYAIRLEAKILVGLATEVGADSPGQEEPQVGQEKPDLLSCRGNRDLCRMVMPGHDCV
jgi:hypothetical protein